MDYNNINHLPFTLKQIKYFVAVVEYKKVTTAAKYVFISPSVITNAIQDLEHYLQVDLFKRTNGGLKLTREGGIFLNQCYEILSVVNSVHNTVQNLSEYRKNILDGHIKLGCTETLSGYLLPKLTMQFAQQFPHIKISMQEYTRTTLEENIINNTIDIAFAQTDNLQNIDSLYYKIIIKSPRQLWVSENHPLLKKDIITLKDIVDEPFVQLTRDEAKSANITYWKKFGLHPNIIFESNCLEAIRGMVSMNKGITILSDMVYRPWSLDGKRIERIKIMNPTQDMNIGLVWSKNYTKSKEMDALINFCQNQKLLM